MLMSVGLLSMSLFLSGVFWLAALHKWRDGDVVRAGLADYQLLPDALVRLLPPTLALLEILLAVGLLIPAMAPLAALAAAFLLAGYTLVLATGLLLGREVRDCGCGGAGGNQPLKGWLVPRNLILTAMAVAVSLGEAGGRTDFYLAVPMALFMLGCYLAVEQLMANHADMKPLGSG